MSEHFDKKQDSVYSKRLKAGKRRTYFFDVRSTRASDYFLTITESRKRMTDDGYDRHKIFLYKEDFHKFMRGLNEAVDFVKTELMPNFDFDSFNHDEADETDDASTANTKPAIAKDLFNKSAFEGMPEIDGHELDKVEALPHMKTDGIDATEQKPKVDSKPESATGHTEDVDRR